MICMSGSLSDAVLVAVGQHCQEARALDGGVHLALVERTGAGEARRDDLAVFGDEVTQDIDVLVVDFFDVGHGEAAEALALEKQRLGVALGALVFVETFGCSHDGPSYVLLKSWMWNTTPLP